MVGDNRQGYALVAAMVIIWAAAVGGISLFEAHLGTAGAGPQLAHGAYEGVESRFGPPGCSLFASSTTVTSTGAVNCFHDSLTPFGAGSRCSTSRWARSRRAGSGPACTASWFTWPWSRCSWPG